MKTIIGFLCVIFFLSLVSCGPPRIADKEQMRIDDSLREIERKAAIYNEEHLIEDIPTISPDTIKAKGN